MKTTIMIAIFALSVFAIFTLLNASVIEQRELARKACNDMPLSCYTPVVSFASLR
jgi:hypothetical protein